jgi:hypothetical protein
MIAIIAVQEAKAPFLANYTRKRNRGDNPGLIDKHADEIKRSPPEAERHKAVVIVT